MICTKPALSETKGGFCFSSLLLEQSLFHTSHYLYNFFIIFQAHPVNTSKGQNSTMVKKCTSISARKGRTLVESTIQIQGVPTMMRRISLKLQQSVLMARLSHKWSKPGVEEANRQAGASSSYRWNGPAIGQRKGSRSNPGRKEEPYEILESPQSPRAENCKNTFRRREEFRFRGSHYSAPGSPSDVFSRCQSCPVEIPIPAPSKSFGLDLVLGASLAHAPMGQLASAVAIGD